MSSVSKAVEILKAATAGLPVQAVVPDSRPSSLERPTPDFNQTLRQPDKQESQDVSGQGTKSNESGELTEKRTDQTKAPRRYQHMAAWFSVHGNKGFNDYMVEAYKEWYEMTGGAAHEYPVDENGQWHSPLWWFVYMLKGHPTIAKNDPSEALRHVENNLQAWRNHALQKGRRTPLERVPTNDPWHDWFDVRRPEARTEFIEAWERMRYVIGQTPLDAAFIAAKQLLRLHLDDQTFKRRGIQYADRWERSKVTDDYEFFITLAGHLQVIVGPNPILLPVELVAEKLDVSARTISTWRRWGVQDGYLKVLKRHVARKNATEFLFNVARFKSLNEKRSKELDGLLAEHFGAATQTS